MKNRIFFISMNLILLLIITVILGITFGNISLSWENVYKILINKTFNREIYEVVWKKSSEVIIWNLRTPRVLMAILSGGGLALVGILMQALTKNSLASPYILGLSSGASTGAVLSIILRGYGIKLYPEMGAFFLGILTSFLVFYISNKNGFSNTKLILSGVALSSFFSGITTFLVTTARNEKDLREAMFWLAGSLSGAKWEEIMLLFISLVITFIFSLVIYRELNILIASEENAETIGVNINKIRILIVIFSTFLTAIIVSVTGVIGFVGLIVPHISRFLVGGNHKKVIIISILLGAIFLNVSDLLTRVLFKNQEIPIGVITSLCGAPFFIWILNGKKIGSR